MAAELFLIGGLAVVIIGYAIFGVLCARIQIRGRQSDDAMGCIVYAVFVYTVLLLCLLYTSISRWIHDELKRAAGRSARMTMDQPLSPVITRQAVSYTHLDVYKRQSQSLAELMRLLIDEQRGGLFLPQNRKHVCTADMLSSIGKHLGHRVRMSNFWAKPATFLASHNQVFRKMFGDAYYELDASDCGFDYHVSTFDESIEDSVASVKTNQTDRGLSLIHILEKFVDALLEVDAA